MIWLFALALAATACGAGPEDGFDRAAKNAAEDPATTAVQTSSTAAIDPQDPEDAEDARQVAEARAVVITTTSCGDAGKAIGSGVAISPTRVLTVAHVIAGASDVAINHSAIFGSEDTGDYPATIIAFDPLRDLALLEIDPRSWTGSAPPAAFPADSPVFEVLAAEETGTIVGGVTSGDVAFTVTEKTIIKMDEVRGTRRSPRSGYLIDAATDRGDSGAGLYADSGQLVGLLFAVSTGNNQRSWATAADELQDFLGDASVTGSFVCNPEESELERLP